MTPGNSEFGAKRFYGRYAGRVLAATLTAAAAIMALPTRSMADEGGVSFWLPGQFGSLAAAPQVPGWALAVVNYYTAVDAGGSVAAARQVTIGRFSPNVNVNLNANLNASANLVFADPSYTFASPIFGGQLALDMAGIVGRPDTDISGTLTATVGPFVLTRQGGIDDGRSGFGDLYPRAILRWNSGVNSWMTYVTGDIPVGSYDSSRLANLGIGHGAVDGGVGYTYFNPETGHELSVVTGLTYNLENPSTNYQNGVDWHVDWAASQFLSKTFHIGAVGYYYQQLTADRGAAAFLGENLSRVAAVGPEMGFVIPSGSVQAYLNFKTYWEFDAANRPSGWNAWVTLSLSPSPPAPASVARAMANR